MTQEIDQGEKKRLRTKRDGIQQRGHVGVLPVRILGRGLTAEGRNFTDEAHLETCKAA